MQAPICLPAPQKVCPYRLLRMVLGLFSVVLIILFLSWLIKKLNVVHVSSAKGLKAEASIMLGPKEKVVLLKAGERYLLLGVEQPR